MTSPTVAPLTFPCNPHLQSPCYGPISDNRGSKKQLHDVRKKLTAREANSSKLWLQLLRFDPDFGEHECNRAENEIADCTTPQRCANREFDTDGHRQR